MTNMRYVIGHPKKHGRHPAVKFADTNVGGGDGFVILPQYALGILHEPSPEPALPFVDYSQLTWH